jgi:hypothetical protein
MIRRRRLLIRKKDILMEQAEGSSQFLKAYYSDSLLGRTRFPMSPRALLLFAAGALAFPLAVKMMSIIVNKLVIVVKVECMIIICLIQKQNKQSWGVQVL